MTNYVFMYDHIQQKKLSKKVLSALLRHCHIFEKVNFILSVSCYNENKLNLTFQLTKGIFN